MSKDIIRAEVSEGQRESAGSSLRGVDEIKNKYIKTGVLRNWANERPIIIPGRKIKVTEIGAERKARLDIVWGIKNDVMAEENGYPKVALVSGPLVSSELDYGVFGDPAPRAGMLVEETGAILEKGGPNIVFVSARTLLGTDINIPTGYVEFEKYDSVTGEKIRVRVGGSQGGVAAQEIGEDGRCISLAKINIDENGEYSYNLDLHFNGGRYKPGGGEINISSDRLPRATVKTFELLLGVIKQEIKEKVIER